MRPGTKWAKAEQRATMVSRVAGVARSVIVDVLSISKYVLHVRGWCGAFALGLLLWTAITAEAADSIDLPEVRWRQLEPGFELTEYTPDPDVFQPHTLIIVRIDPAKVEFVLLNASETGEATSLRGWAERASLIAAINASMYLPDALTSTGHMRGPAHINNPRIVSRFGSFFVAAPRIPASGLPDAAILDRDIDPWSERLDAYNIVIQNYRLINAEGRVLWAPGGPSYAVSAIGADKSGRILFIHCREPLTGENFARLLLDMPLEVRVVMYVEGGPQAGLLVRAGDVDMVWMGRHVADFLTSGNKNAPLPNVLGVRRRMGGGESAR